MHWMQLSSHLLCVIDIENVDVAERHVCVCVCVCVCTAASSSSVDEKGKYNVTLYFMLTYYQYILIAAVEA